MKKIQSRGRTCFVPTPFIIHDVTRNLQVDPSLYGRALGKCVREEISSKVRPVAGAEPVNIIGIAARDWKRGTGRTYSKNDLLYHLRSAYLAFMGQVACEGPNVVHTAPWGCGAFNNSELMITAIQMLAARMAGVELVFHGIGNRFNPNYDVENINKLAQLVDCFTTPEEALEEFFKLQASDRRWAPKDKW